MNLVGDIRFRRDVVLKGDVRLANRLDRQAEITDGTSVEGKKRW